MVQAILDTRVTLYDLEQRFHLQQAESDSFFDEWKGNLPALTEEEKGRLDRVEHSVSTLEKRSLLENTVKLAVLAPLLDLSDLFFPPFYVSTEEAVNIEAVNEDITIQGRIDVLVLKEALWLLVIESKRAEFSPKVGIPQALSYMLAAPDKTMPVYGLVTNGTDFVFLKMTFEAAFGNEPRYGRSRQFVLGQDNDLEQVLRILKHLAGEISKAPG